MTEDDEWVQSEYCKIYVEMSQGAIKSIGEFEQVLNRKYFYKIHFFKINPSASEEDFIKWKKHQSIGDWESDIWIMSDDEFLFFWPWQAFMITEFMEMEDE
ncbi:MAG: hypothetical protein CXT71_08270 [Methanobacteriota archaeon]|jgi:hypothetical protein|nr:MAG: hypothetical protein CXT71_08270 [Euryarchaeota archaeon]